MVYDRRDFIKSVGIAGTVGIAGCTGGTEGGFPTDDIRWVIPYGEGGGFGTYAQMIADHWSDQFDDANVEPDYVTGAAGAVGAEEIYRSDSDGSTVGMFNMPSHAYVQMLRDVEYDVSEFTYFARFALNPGVLLTRPDEAPNDYDELREMDEVTIGTTGVGSSTWAAAKILGEAIGVNFEVVAGYDPLASTITALMQGELDLALVVDAHAREHVNAGDVEVLLALDNQRQDLYGEATLTSEVDELEGIRHTYGAGRIAGGPPGIEGEPAETLESSLWEALNSDELQQLAEESGYPINSLARGDEVTEIVEDTADIVSEYEDFLVSEMEQANDS